MKLLTLVPADTKVLHKKTKTIPPEMISQPTFQKLIDDMITTMYESNGIGLAATQIGEPIALATLVPDPNRFNFYAKGTREAIVIINPRILKKSLRCHSDEEGCLSVPTYLGSVKRHNSVTVSYVDRHGEKQTIKSTGLLAHVFQHEIDHLDGILFIDHAKKLFKIEHI